MHPLTALSAAEFAAIQTAITSRPEYAETTRFAYVGLEEPPKNAVLAWEAGSGPRPARLARVQLLDSATGRSTDNVVDIATGEIVQASLLDGTAGQLPILELDSALIAEILAADTNWVAALAARGLAPADVVVVPLSAGNYGLPGEQGRRILRSLAFKQDHPKDHPWAHPVDGLTAYIDTIARVVLDIIDTPGYRVPLEHGNFDDPDLQGAPLDTLKPIAITQPEGVSFTVDGEIIEWGNWKLRIGFDWREGLVLRQLCYLQRPVIYRASIAEMVVPYGDPSRNRFWQNFFDAGEYLFGRSANSLENGCDCLGEIHYFDAVLADELGSPRVINNAVCLHEEDFGALWKHTDPFTGSRQVRRSRRLVISFFTSVGNYDYGFFWYLYLDGTIEGEVKLTGVPFTSAYPGPQADGSPYPWASQVAPGLAAPYHQHLFSARLDMMVDGLANVVNEIDAVRVPAGPGNEYGGAFTRRVTPLESEAVSGRCAEGSVGRVWQIASTEKTDRLGHPTSYLLCPTHTPVLLAADDSVIAQRAAFATKHLWVTRYHPAQRYAAGDFINQHPGGAGLPEYIADDEPLIGQDLVVWHTFGLTHFPRNEDWPVMPMDYAKFTLKPYNFCDRNPVLNVPASQPACAAHAGRPQAPPC